MNLEGSNIKTFNNHDPDSFCKERIQATHNCSLIQQMKLNMKRSSIISYVSNWNGKWFRITIFHLNLKQLRYSGQKVEKFNLVHRLTSNWWRMSWWRDEGLIKTRTTWSIKIWVAWSTKDRARWTQSRGAWNQRSTRYPKSKCSCASKRRTCCRTKVRKACSTKSWCARSVKVQDTWRTKGNKQPETCTLIYVLQKSR